MGVDSNSIKVPLKKQSNLQVGSLNAVVGYPALSEQKRGQIDQCRCSCNALERARNRIFDSLDRMLNVQTWTTATWTTTNIKHPLDAGLNQLRCLARKQLVRGHVTLDWFSKSKQVSKRVSKRASRSERVSRIDDGYCNLRIFKWAASLAASFVRSLVLASSLSS